MDKPRTPAELWNTIGVYFGVWLPWKSYTRGNSSPFQFVADGFFNPGKDIAAWACRSGGKTLDSSILARLEHLWTPGLQGRVLSGSKDQALNLYKYWSDWVAMVAPFQVSGKVQITKTKINGGGLEILTASEKSVRGPKVQRLYNDEVDEIDIVLLEASTGMLATREGLPARTVYTSTWHRVNGSMGKLVDKCPDNGVTLHRWNIWECISQCGEERHDRGRNCPTCPLGADCLAARAEYGNALRVDSAGKQGSDKSAARLNSNIGIAAERHGIFHIEDAIKRWKTLSRPTIDAEYLCLRPSPEGMVYPSFDPHKHCQLKKAPDGLKIYRTIDWGYRTFVCLWIGVDKNETVYLLDTYKAEDGTLKTHADYINAHPIKNITDTFCDPAGRQANDQTGRSNVDTLRGYGITCRFRLDKRSVDVANGIQLVQNHLNPASGPPRFFIINTPANKAATRSLQGYENMKVNGVYIDKPKDPQEYEHIPDALRYFFVNTARGPAMFSGRPGAA